METALTRLLGIDAPIVDDTTSTLSAASAKAREAQ